jgi:S1-C subfamily serine protease
MFPQSPRIFTLPPGAGGGFRGNDRFGNGWFSLNNGTKLGLQVQDTQNGEGAEILGITADSPAEKAGFQKEDIVTELAGKTIKSAADLSKAYRENQDKTQITAKVKRDGKLTPISIEIPKELHKADL